MSEELGIKGLLLLLLVRALRLQGVAVDIPDTVCQDTVRHNEVLINDGFNHHLKLFYCKV